MIVNLLTMCGVALSIIILILALWVLFVFGLVKWLWIILSIGVTTVFILFLGAYLYEKFTT